MNFNGLCMSSGGVKGIVMLGALNYYYTANQTNNIKYYAGTSVGSIIVYLFSMGYTPL